MCRLEREGFIRSIPRDLVIDYQMHKIKQETWVKFLDKGRTKLHNNGFDIRVLDTFGAPPPFKKEWYEGFGKFAGSATHKDLADIFGISTRSNPHRDLLMLPYYDMPGRPANLRTILHSSRSISYKDRPTLRSGGLFMLDSVAPCAEYVIAVDDPMLACQVQMKRMESSLVHIPIVAWHPDTRYWPINPKRIVFWAPTPNVATFNQARKVSGAYICSPRNNRDFEAILRDKDVKNWVHHVMMDAQPWCIALKDTLLSMDEMDAVKFARELDITPMETGELLFECTTAEKALLSEVLDLRATVRNALVGDNKIIERDNAWWTYTGKGRLVRVFNASFSIDWSAHYEGKGSYLIGTLTTESKSERFMAPADSFMSGPTKWLRKFALKNGMGIIQVLSGWDSRLIDISFKFNTENVEHIDDKAIVGWSDSFDKFRFPNLSLINGAVDERDLGMPSDGMPCIKITGHPTKRSTWSAFIEDSPSNRVLWAIMSCVAMNTAARMLGQETKKIGVIGPQRNLSLIATSLDLPAVQAASANSISKRVDTYSMHDIPVCVFPSCGFKSFVNWLEGSGVRNIMIHLSYSQAALLGGMDWVFVDARDMGGAIRHFHSGTNLLADMIRVLQTSGLGKGLNESGFLDLVPRWLRNNNKCKHDSSVFVSARELITPCSIYGALSNCETFLFSIFTMIMENQLSVSRSMMTKKVGDVDISEKRIRISKNLVQRMLLPVGVSTLTAELNADGYLNKNSTSEWHINRTKWDEQYTKWLKLTK